MLHIQVSLSISWAALAALACQPPAMPGPEIACRQTMQIDAAVVPADTFPYRLDAPDKTYTLTAELKEISGLSLSENGQYLLAVQDEKGLLYQLDKNSGTIRKVISFGKDDDYEGVEAVGKAIYVLKSSGSLLRISKPGQKGQQVTTYKNFLNKDYDVEGLAYDPKNSRLLLACKGIAGEGQAYRDKRAIYAFDLRKKQLDSIPVLCLGLDDVRQYLEGHTEVSRYDDLLELFAPGSSEFNVKPAAIAVHPHTGDWYLVSGPNRLLLVLSPEGVLRYLFKLRGKVLDQPEGCCIDADGTLYISSEGVDRPAVIQVFYPFPERGLPKK